MRVSVALLVASLILPGLATAGDAPDEHMALDDGPGTLVAPTNGTFLLGAFGDRLSGTDMAPSEDVVAATHHSWQANVTDCHRRLYADLAWHPTSASGDPGAPIDLPYVFDIAIEMNGTEHVRRVLEPRDGIYLGELPDDGDLTVHLVLRQGVVVDWTFAAYAHKGLRSCAEPL